MIKINKLLKIPNIDNQCNVIEISENDYFKCEVISQGNNYWANSKGGEYGEGLCKTDDDKYKPVRTGLLGQTAFSYLIDEPVDLIYRNGGDRYDNIVCGVTFDIKCATKNYGANLIYHTNEWGTIQPLDKDIYIGSFLEMEDRNNNIANVCIVGFLFATDILNDTMLNTPVRAANGKKHLNYRLPFSRFRPIELLVAEIKKQKLKRLDK